MVTRKKVTTTRPEPKPETKPKEQPKPLPKQQPQRPLGVGKYALVVNN